MLKGDINENIKEYGYIKPNFYADEIEAIKSRFGIECSNITDFKEAFLLKMGITPHARVVLTQEEKTSRSVQKIANSYGVSEEDLKKALRLLKLQ